MTADLL